MSAGDDAIGAVLKNRATKYGPYEDNAILTQQLYNMLQSTSTWENVPQSLRHGLYMIVHKVARAVTGDPLYNDNYVDIAGYAKCNLLEVERLSTLDAFIATALSSATEIMSRAQKCEQPGEEIKTYPDAEPEPDEVEDAAPNVRVYDGVLSDQRVEGINYISVGEQDDRYIVNRRLEHSSVWSHLARMPVEATYAEFLSLPTFYKALYDNCQREDGRFVMKPRYTEYWGK